MSIRTPRARRSRLLVDSLRADRLSCYGSQRLSTPAFDTLPAHSSLMTGTFLPAGNDPKHVYLSPEVVKNIAR